MMVLHPALIPHYMAEWTKAICGLFKKANTVDVEHLFREFDEDCGGSIDYEEFVCTLRSAKETKKEGQKSSRRSQVEVLVL